MKTAEIRKLFLDYFKSKGHVIVPSSTLVPNNDPSLLFTNAGMVQFKKIFLGQEEPKYTQAASCQRCLRAGGKHNDLENVGFTSRHHTFFEMLGNFSFGSYFKKEAILYAWDFITNYLKIPAERLWITVFKDDLEAADIWLKQIQIDPNKFSKCDEQENFWAMGDTGPCGPCTEIYYDHGDSFIGDPPGIGDPGERYVEIYNLVFMQYNRFNNGEIHPLPKPCVDTGMGLERVAAIMQSVHNNYHIDIFTKLIKDIAELLNCLNLNHPSLKVIADHLRACCFLVVDGVLPSNENRGYVLRRIMRRAIRHGYKLERREPFLYLLINSVIDVMGQDFSFLQQHKSHIEQVFLNEEIQFAKTLENGIKLLQQEIQNLINNNNGNNTIDGEVVFKLYDTFGFPIDLTMDIAKEHGFNLDLQGFEKCMLEQKVRGRQLNKFKECENLELEEVRETDFIGYDQTETENSIIIKIFDAKTNQQVDSFMPGDKAKIILSSSPFYPESGGQVGDTGMIINNLGAKFLVADTQKLAKANIHIGELLTGKLSIGDTVIAKIDVDRRQKIKLNHSATHLLHAALRKVLGPEVKQKGSVVDDKRLRFDFEHSGNLTQDQISAINFLINDKIRSNFPTVTKIMSKEEAIDSGAIALFDDKYQDQVRVLNIADSFSIELCGGTHVARSGDIGCFIIIKEEAIASGIRRIEAITGEEAVKHMLNNHYVCSNLLKLLKITDPLEIKNSVNKSLQRVKQLEKELDLCEQKASLLKVKELINKAEKLPGGCGVLVSKVEISPKYLKLSVDQLKQSLNKAVIVLGCEHNGKAMVIVGVTKNLINISAIDLIQKISAIIEGKGGGRNDLAEASGTKLTELSVALGFAREEIIKQLSNL
jgi:alanyl-tRNA synthetase